MAKDTDETVDVQIGFYGIPISREETSQRDYEIWKEYNRQRLNQIEKYRRLVIKAAQQCDPSLWNELQELSNFLWELQEED